MTRSGGKAGVPLARGGQDGRPPYLQRSVFDPGTNFPDALFPLSGLLKNLLKVRALLTHGERSGTT